MEPPAQTGATGILVAMRGFRESLQKKAEAACRREEETAQRRFERERRAFVAAAWAAISEAQLMEETKTDIVGVVESLLDSGIETAFIVTDGIDTSGRVVSEFDLPAGARVVLILVPADQKYGARKATEGAAAKWRAAGIGTLAYTALVTPSAWGWLTNR